MKNEIYDPLLNEFIQKRDEETDILDIIREQIKAYSKVEGKMEREETEYVDISIEYEKSMRLFEIKRREEGTNFYKSKNFSFTNLKLRETEDKAREL